MTLLWICAALSVGACLGFMLGVMVSSGHKPAPEPEVPRSALATTLAGYCCDRLMHGSPGVPEPGALQLTCEVCHNQVTLRPHSSYAQVKDIRLWPNTSEAIQ